MNRKASSITAIVAAAAVAALPVSGAVAQTSAPAVVALSAPAPLTPTSVVKDVAAATTVASNKFGLAPLVVVTDEAASPAAQGAALAPAASDAPAAPIALPEVPKAVTDALNIAGLPVALVWRVVQTANGIYTVWYKALNTVPDALLKGQFGAIPSLFTGAINDSLTWIATGAGPKKPDPAAAGGTAAAPTLPQLEVPSVITNGLNVLGIPVQAAWATFQTGVKVYTTLYGLQSSIPNAIIKGQWGDVPTLITKAITDSVAAVINLPIGIVTSASDSITKLIADLTPKPAAPTVSADAVAPVTAATKAALTADAGSAAKPVTTDAPASTGGDSTAAATTAASTQTSGAKTPATTPTESTSSEPSETKTPEAKTPETKTPETKTPETKTPETKTPETASTESSSAGSTGAAEKPSSSSAEKSSEATGTSGSSSASSSSSDSASSGSGSASESTKN